jgi:radical SAM protein with 4Fe4S-binding SPASM domain
MQLGKKIYQFFFFGLMTKKILYLFLRILPGVPLYRLAYQKWMRLKMRKGNSAPKSLMIENTNICTANCSFCPHQKMKRPEGVMKMSLYKKIIDEASQIGVKQITLHGFGEPFMDKLFFKRVAYAKSKGNLKVITNTNGMFLDSKIISQIIGSGLDEIYISFDAASVDTYRKIRPGLDYFMVESNIIKLLEEKERFPGLGLKIYLSFIENSINKKEVRAYYQKWRGKVDGVSISLMHNWAGELGQERRALQKDPCRLLWTDLVISWDGRAPLCCNDYENAVIIGDLNKQNILTVWRGEELAKIRSWHKGFEFSKVPLCQRCSLNYHCRLPWWGV